MRKALLGSLTALGFSSLLAIGCGATLPAAPPAAAPVFAPPAPPVDRAPLETAAEEPEESEEEPAPPPPQRFRPPSLKGREQAAVELLSNGDPARSLIQWKILALLDPENPTYAARIEELRRTIATGVREHLTLAEAARKRGDLKTASEEYLKALARDPLDPTAPPLLREIERAGTRDQELAKGRRALKKPSAMTTPAPAQSPSSNSEAAYYLATGVELFRQGEYEASIVEFEKHVRSYPEDKKAHKYLADAHARLGSAALKTGDAASALRHFEEARRNEGKDTPQVTSYLQQARRKIADDLYEKGVRASRSDLKKAIELWKQCLSADPSHVAAKSQLDKAVKMQEKLRKIQ